MNGVTAAMDLPLDPLDLICTHVVAKACLMVILTE